MNTAQKLLTQILIDGGIEEAYIEAKMLIEHFCQINSVDLAMGKPIENIDLAIEKAQERVETGRPIQHIIGVADFMGEKFIVNENVLIPRDETEILVRKAAEIVKTHCSLLQGQRETGVQYLPLPPALVLDIGTGSGCIACMIAKKTSAQVLGIDVSTDALQVALDNALALNLSNRAIFRKSDLFAKIHTDEKFDIIVSNPPYIPISQKEDLQAEVKNFDPDLALFAPDDLGLDFYREIVQKAPNHLKTQGYLIFELGIGQAQAVKSMMSKQFESIEIIKDLAGIERVIYGRMKI